MRIVKRNQHSLWRVFWKKYIFTNHKMSTPLASDTPPFPSTGNWIGALVFFELGFTWFCRHRLLILFIALVRHIVIQVQGGVLRNFSSLPVFFSVWSCRSILLLENLCGKEWLLQGWPRGEWRWCRRRWSPLLLWLCRLMWLSLNWVEWKKMVNFIPPLFILHTLLFSY